LVTLVQACRTWGIWRNMQRSMLPQTLEDVDIVFAICARRNARSLSVSRLIAECVGSRNTILRRLRALIDQGLVSMETSAADRRSRDLMLTRKGILLAKKTAGNLRKLGTVLRRPR
jgi:DNA-binding MarR family transcriptional regulator